MAATWTEPCPASCQQPEVVTGEAKKRRDLGWLTLTMLRWAWADADADGTASHSVASGVDVCRYVRARGTSVPNPTMREIE